MVTSLRQFIRLFIGGAILFVSPGLAPYRVLAADHVSKNINTQGLSGAPMAPLIVAPGNFGLSEIGAASMNLVVTDSSLGIAHTRIGERTYVPINRPSHQIGARAVLQLVHDRPVLNAPPKDSLATPREMAPRASLELAAKALEQIDGNQAPERASVLDRLFGVFNRKPAGTVDVNSGTDLTPAVIARLSSPSSNRPEKMGIAVPVIPEQSQNLSAHKSSANWFVAATVLMMLGGEIIGSAMQTLIALKFGGTQAVANTMAVRLAAAFAGKIVAGHLAKNHLKATFATTIFVRLVAITSLIFWYLGPAFMGPLGVLLAPYHASEAIRMLVVVGIVAIDSFVAGMSGNGGALERPILQRLVGDTRGNLERIGSLREWLNAVASIAGPLIGLLGMNLIKGDNLTSLILTLAAYPMALLVALIIFAVKVKIPAVTHSAVNSNDSDAKMTNPQNESVFKLIKNNPLLRAAVVGAIGVLLLNFLIFQCMASAYALYASHGDVNSANAITSNIFIAASIGALIGGLLNWREGKLLEKAKDMITRSATGQDPRNVVGSAAKVVKTLLSPIKSVLDWVLLNTYLKKYIEKAKDGQASFTHHEEDKVLNRSIILWLSLTTVGLLAFTTMLFTNPLYCYLAMIPLFVAQITADNKLWSLVGSQSKSEAGRVIPFVGAMASAIGAMSLFAVGQLFEFFKGGIMPFVFLNMAIGMLGLVYLWVIRQLWKNFKINEQK